MNKQVLRKDFPFVSDNTINAATTFFGGKYKTERGVLNYLSKVNIQNQIECERPDVNSMSCHIQWSKDCNPTLRAVVVVGEYRKEFVTRAGGWGYDKISTVLADLFNRFCKGMLYRARHKRNCPYGVHMEKGNYYFESGVGLESYKEIAKFLIGFNVQIDRSQKEDDYLLFYK